MDSSFKHWIICSGFLQWFNGIFFKSENKKETVEEVIFFFLTYNPFLETSVSQQFKQFIGQAACDWFWTAASKDNLYLYIHNNIKKSIKIWGHFDEGSVPMKGKKCSYW